MAVPGALARLARAVATALTAARAPAPASIGLVLSNDRELAQLNEQHMGETGPTDVLSFPLLPPSAYPAHAGRPALAQDGRDFALPPRSRPHLGDVVVSVEQAVAQASEGRGGQSGDQSWSTEEELRLLVVHGTLHVCGWDHARPAEAEAMRELERRILGRQ